MERIEYDPNRTAYIALVTYADKEKSYIICPQVKKGDQIETGNVDIKVGNALELKDIPPGTSLHTVELILVEVNWQDQLGHHNSFRL